MKSPLFLTRLAPAVFLLSATHLLSAQTVVFSEAFSGFTTGTHASPSTFDQSASLDTKTSVPGWTGYKVYSAGGEIKLGTAEVPGWIETPVINFSGYEGDLFLKFDISRWQGDETSVRVLLNGSPVGSTLTPADEFGTIEILITAGILNGKIRFESLAKRFYLDNVLVIEQNATGLHAVEAKPFPVRIYPNPVKEIVIIENILLYDRLEVYTVSGRLIRSVELTDNMSIEYSMSGYGQGLYLFRFLSQGAVLAVKVVKY